MTRIKRILAKAVDAWQRSLPGGVVSRYARHQGGLLANGLAYGLLFAFFAGIWTLFSILGLVVSLHAGLQTMLLSTAERLAPGIASTLESSGALSQISGTLTWTGLVTLVSFWWSITGWMGSLRSAVSSMFDDDTGTMDVIKAKLWDSLGILLVFILLILSTAAGAVSGGLVRTTLQLVGVSSDSFAASLLLDLTGLATGLLLNFSLFVILLHVVAHIPLDRFLIIGSLLGAIAFSAMQMLGTRLLTGATKNPLLAPFAGIVGVLIWFNLMVQVIIVVSAIIAETRHRSHGATASKAGATA